MADEIEWTTITLPKPVKEDLDTERGNEPWGSFLEGLRQEQADPVTFNSVEELAKRLETTVETTLTEDAKDKIAQSVAEQMEDSVRISAEDIAQEIVFEPEREDMDLDELINEMDKLKQLVDTIPERTAEEFGSKYR